MAIPYVYTRMYIPSCISVGDVDSSRLSGLSQFSSAHVCTGAKLLWHQRVPIHTALSADGGRRHVNSLYCIAEALPYIVSYL